MSEVEKNIKVRKGLPVSGVLMIAAGILAWVFPDTAILAAAIYIGFLFLISGGAYLTDFYYFRSGWLLATGLLDLILGIILVLNLGVTLASLPLVLALWILGVAVTQVAFGIDAKAAKDASWKWLMISGMTGILFGLWILGTPLIGFLTVSTLVGGYFVFYGILSLTEYYQTGKANRATVR